MTRIALSVVLSAVLGSWLCTAPAQAQTRAFVSAQGSDANPCTFALPCRTFQHAHDIVVAGGEIDVLDPAGYGSLSINKAISIQGHGYAGITAAAGNAISISAGASAKINLRGLLIDGLGTGNHGISFLAGGSVEIQDSVIRNFADVCINAEPAGSAVLLISGTHVSLAGGSTEGIFVRPSGAGTVTGVFDSLVVENNSGPGIDIVGDNSTGTVNFTISNSVVANNNNGGIISRSTSAPTVVMVQNSTIANNAGTAGLGVSGAPAVMRVTKSVVTGNPTGLALVSGGTLEKFGDNAVRGNTVADVSAGVTTVSLQ